MQIPTSPGCRCPIVWLWLILVSAKLLAQTRPLVSQPNTDTAADSVITFNEIMYHPTGDDPRMEWLELYNQMSVNMDISNWRVEGGIDFRFPTNTTLNANRYLVIAADPDALRTTSGATNVFGPFSKRLSNSGEILRLRNNSSRLMDEMTYSDEDRWPVSADGSGASLAKKGRFDASSPAANWRASVHIGGTPGQINFLATQSITPQADELLHSDSTSKWVVPMDDGLGATWMAPGFDDSGWTPGKSALGYDTTPPGPTDVTNVALGRVVIDGSGAYNNNPFDLPDAAGNFVAQNVVDGSGGDTFGVNYWLGREGKLNEYFTLDLGASVKVQEIRLRNTHNTQYNDRGTAKFQIYGAERVDANKQLIQPLLILSGTLPNVRTLDPIPANSFTPLNGLTVTNLRYLKFVALTAISSANNVGLNEIEIYAPSPTGAGAYRGLFATDVQSSLYKKQSALFVRLPFAVLTGKKYDLLTLRMRYADGFVAYLNGAEVLRRNAPQIPTWNSRASVDRPTEGAVQLESFDLSQLARNLTAGQNILAIQGLNSATDDAAFLLSAQLSARQAEQSLQPDVGFSETAPAGNRGFFVELANNGTESVHLANWRIVSESGLPFSFGEMVIGGGAYLALRTNDLGFTVTPGQRLFLIGSGQSVVDAVELRNRLRGRLASGTDGRWAYPTEPTPGAPNHFALHDEIVINEIMYHHPPIHGANHEPLVEVDEEWVELYNRSAFATDLSGWRLDGEVTFSVPPNTVIAPGGYLVIARNAALLQAKYPGIAIVGNFNGKLSANGGQVVLVDNQDNRADEVTYYSDHPWPAYANGGGSSLELRDPRADNSVPESWVASNEVGKASWQHYSYRAKAVTPVYSPALFGFHEFRLGLLAEGEALVDNVTVQELSAGAPRQLLQNPTFTSGTSKWRLLGNHSHSFVEPRPEDSTDPVLHLVARGPKSYMDNRLETTLRVGTTVVPVVTGREYQIDFDAKWVAGSPQIHTELYYNKVTKTTIIERPDRFGTPGRQNSTYVTNAGPTYWGLRHSPTLPKTTEDIEVSIQAADPDDVAALKLFYIVKGVAQNVGMLRAVATGTEYVGTLPRQVAGTVIQFYVEGIDSRGSRSTYPREGAGSRALIKVDTTRFLANKQTFRTIMTPGDAGLMHAFTNLMSDDLLGCTVVHNETEAFYDAKIRLHGSMFSRTDATSTGMTIKFPTDHLFRGSRPSVIARRRGMVETFVKHILNAAGNIPGNYDDMIYFVSHRPDNVGNARLNLANYDDTYIDSQFEGNNDGTVFKLEGIREFQATSTGGAEGYKLPMPIGWILNYDIANLGDDPEQYRWSIMIQSERSRDDYSSIVRMGKAFSMTGAALRQSAGAAIDVDEWARLFALQLLLGIGDVYAVDNPHNLCFYARPDDGRVVALQNDWEFAFAAQSFTSIYGNKNLAKVLQLPGYRRLYQGHLLDLITSVCNRTYLTPWARHYGTLTGEGYTGHPSYVESRANSVKSRLMAQVPFEITTNGGADFAVSNTAVTLQGRGWINVRHIGRTGDPVPLELNWLDDQAWQAVIPLRAGANQIELIAYGFRGQPLAQDSITITTTISEFPQRDNLRIAEFMYHPADPSVSERAAGFTNGDDFEYVELLNTGAADVVMAGVKFTAGITFDFTQSSIALLGPSERALIVKNRAAFELRYGKELPIAGEYAGSLNNAGETVRLEDSQNALIQEITYGDSGAWHSAADGSGRSLEVVDFSGDFNAPTNWQTSVVIGGTPGAGLVVRPEILSLEYRSSQVRIRFTAAAGQSYSVYRRTDLTAGSWAKIAAISPQPNARIEQAVDSPNGQHHFYRIVTP